MRLLPAVAAVITAALAVINVFQGDWGVVVVNVLLCAVSVRAYVMIGPPPGDRGDDEAERR